MKNLLFILGLLGLIGNVATAQDVFERNKAYSYKGKDGQGNCIALTVVLDDENVATISQEQVEAGECTCASLFYLLYGHSVLPDFDPVANDGNSHLKMRTFGAKEYHFIVLGEDKATTYKTQYGTELKIIAGTTKGAITFDGRAPKGRIYSDETGMLFVSPPKGKKINGSVLILRAKQVKFAK